jgi:hypothetical protein
MLAVIACCQHDSTGGDYIFSVVSQSLQIQAEPSGER